MEREPNKRLGAHHTAQVKAGCFGALRSWESESDFGFQSGICWYFTGVSWDIQWEIHPNSANPMGKSREIDDENVLAGKIPL